MRLDKVEDQSFQSDERNSVHDNNNPPNLLTPARRAALDALEREFRDLLQAR